MTSDGVLGELGDVVERAMPDAWSAAHVDLIVVGKLSETTARVFLEDGSSQDVAERLGWDFDDLVDRLKAAGHREGQGSWLTVALTCERVGRVTLDFDYGGEPKWSTPVSALTYVEEQEKFPRAAGSMPEWFAAKLREADGSEG